MIIVDNVAKKNAEEFWKQFDNLVEKNENLQERINKALEYIKSVYERNEDGTDYIWILDFGEIENILKGDE